MDEGEVEDTGGDSMSPSGKILGDTTLEVLRGFAR